jgi:heterodisulfide reductase subunit C2
MTIRINKKTAGKRLIDSVQKYSGVDLTTCYQCRKCSNGCPAARHSTMTPSEIVRRLQLGAGEELLQSDFIWLCLSCETCFARCPMQINLSAVMDALRTLSISRAATSPKGNMPLFDRLFLGMVKRYGRTYDLAAIALYKLRAGNLTQDINKFPTMLKKGKMAVLPPSGADKDAVRRVFRTVEGVK